jgi:hypothetical protein
MLSSHTILYLAASACLIRPCGAAEPADLVEQLKHLGPLPRIAPDLKQRVTASLPREGEVKALSAEYRKKLQSVAPSPAGSSCSFPANWAGIAPRTCEEECRSSRLEPVSLPFNQSRSASTAALQP